MRKVWVALSVLGILLGVWWAPPQVERYRDGTIREPGLERRWARELREEWLKAGIAEAAHRSLVVDLPQTSADATNLTDLAGVRFYRSATVCPPGLRSTWPAGAATQIGQVAAPAPDPAPGATATLPITDHTLTGFACATAFDLSGNESSASNSVPIPDMIAPTVTVTAPATGPVSGTVVVTATAADAVGVVGVQFRLDGANLGVEDTTAPFSISWNTLTATNGTHTLSAVARDAAGNSTTSAGVIVTVANDVTGPQAPSGLTVQ